MPDTHFALDPRLAVDTLTVTSLDLCEVRLMNDARYTWLVLVPQRDSSVEITDLTDAEQATLWQEVNQATAALRAVVRCDKLNIGALGNIVRQLHVHVIARIEGDAAWPRPVWGHGDTETYEPTALSARIDALRQAFNHGSR